MHPLPARLAYAAATFGLCCLTQLFLVREPAAAPAIQFIVVAMLGASLGFGTWWLAQRLHLWRQTGTRLDGILVTVLAGAFSLTWGRPIFMSFFYHDEIGYFAVVNQNWWTTWQWIMEPLNEHFQPPLKLCFAIICNVWGINNYFGVALAMFLAAVALCVTFYRFLREATGSSLLAFVAAGLFATAFDFADVYQYKAAGFPIVVSILFLLLGLLQILPAAAPVASDSKIRVGYFAVWLGIAVFFSSLTTAPLCFAAAFLVTGWLSGGPGTSAGRRTALLGLIALLPTALLFFFRSKLQIPPPQHLDAIQPELLLRMIGSFATQPFGAPVSTALAAGVTTVALLFVSAGVLAARCWFRDRWPDRLGHVPSAFLPLLIFGLLVPVIGATQVFAGRGFQLAGQGYHRYEIFPVIGTCSALVALVSFAWHGVGIRTRPVAWFWPAGAGLALLVFSVTSHHRLAHQWAWSLDTCRQVNQERRDFFNHLERVVQEIRYHNMAHLGIDRQAEFTALPNLRIERASLGLDDYLLQYYARSLASPRYDALYVPFIPWDAAHHATLGDAAAWPQTAAFLRRYFPEQAAALATAPAPNR
jgi:hypothetical protein